MRLKCREYCSPYGMSATLLSLFIWSVVDFFFPWLYHDVTSPIISYKHALKQLRVKDVALNVQQKLEKESPNRQWFSKADHYSASLWFFPSKHIWTSFLY